MLSSAFGVVSSKGLAKVAPPEKRVLWSKRSFARIGLSSCSADCLFKSALPSRSCSNLDQSLLVFAVVSSYLVLTFTPCAAVFSIFRRCLSANSSYAGDSALFLSGVYLLRLKLEFFRRLLLDDLRRLALLLRSLCWLRRIFRLLVWLDCSWLSLGPNLELACNVLP